MKFLIKCLIVKSILVGSAMAADFHILPSIDRSSNQFGVKVVNKTNCDGFGCSTTTKKVRHKASGKTVVKKKTCDDFGKCYTTITSAFVKV